MKKEEVLKIIDEVMNNREIDSIRNAILAIRDKVIELPDMSDDGFTARLWLRGEEMHCISPYFEGAKYVCIDTCMKLDSHMYGAYWYE